MKLRNRNLTNGTQGADVALLQRELRQLGLAITDEETHRSSFGPTTQRAVQEFQRQKGLEPNGVVDQHTAARLTGELAKQQPRKVTGTVRHSDDAPAAGLTVHAFD